LGTFERCRAGALTLLCTCAVVAAPAPRRLEARSSDLLAVGVVEQQHLCLHVSRLLDNAPVRDATVSVTLRGVTHPTLVAADGCYGFDDKDLTLPGAAQAEIAIDGPALHEKLRGTLQGGAGDKSEEDKSQVRQYGWWVLNFGVCIGFLMLLSRRKKSDN
jgi:hypothetical protein